MNFCLSRKKWWIIDQEHVRGQFLPLNHVLFIWWIDVLTLQRLGTLKLQLEAATALLTPVIPLLHLSHFSTQFPSICLSDNIDQLISFSPLHSQLYGGLFVALDRNIAYLLSLLTIPAQTSQEARNAKTLFIQNFLEEGHHSPQGTLGRHGQKHLVDLNIAISLLCNFDGTFIKDLFGPFEASTRSTLPTGPLNGEEILHCPSLPRKFSAKCILLSCPSKGLFPSKHVWQFQLKDLLIFLTLSFQPLIPPHPLYSFAQDFFLTVLYYSSVAVYELFFVSEEDFICPHD